MISWQIKGGKELAALMARLPVEVETKILRNGLAAGARVIRDDARERAPRKSGGLAASIKTASAAKSEEGTVTARVKLSGPHAFLGIFMEYGVLAHLIWATGGRNTLVIKGVPIGKRIEHPGLAPRPFMRPALDAKAGEAIQAVGDYLTRHLTWGTVTAPTVDVDLKEAA